MNLHFRLQGADVQLIQIASFGQRSAVSAKLGGDHAERRTRCRRLVQDHLR